MRRLPLAAVLVLSACYQYVPSGTAAAPMGSEVRLVLSQAGASALVPILGRETIAVEGRVSSLTDNSYVVAVSGTLKRGPSLDGVSAVSRTTWAGEAVTIPRAAVASVEQRSLEPRRTGFAVVVGAALTFAAVRLITHAIGSSGGGTEGGTVISP
jgi:hypothetical protein